MGPKRRKKKKEKEKEEVVVGFMVAHGLSFIYVL